MKYMKKINIFVAVLLLALCSVGVGQAQVGNPLPLLEEGVDARAVAMGNLGLLSSDRNHLYTNPTSLVQIDGAKISATLGGSVARSMPGAEGRLMHGVASVGYRFLDRHALFLGARYQGGLSFKSNSGQFGNTGKARTLSPFEYTVDLGYAFRLSDHWSAFAIGSFFQSYSGRSVMGGFGGLGVNYRTSFDLSGMDGGILNVAAKVSDVTVPIYYSSREGFNLPSKAELVGDFRMLASKNLEATFALGGRYYFLPADNRTFQANVGAEVKYYKIVALRAGYQYSQAGNNFLTVGGGVEYFGVKLDVAYLKTLQKDFRFSERLVGTLSYSF